MNATLEHVVEICLDMPPQKIFYALGIFGHRYSKISF